MKNIYENNALKILEEDLKGHDYLDPMKDIVFKSILKKDKKHIIVRIIIKELLGLEFFDIKEKDSGFTAKGRNQRGEACDYMVTVEGKTISLECNKNYDNRLFARNISHLRRMIIGEDFESIQINIDNYDIGGEDKLIYEYCLREKEGKGKEIYENLIKIFHINMPKLEKIVYNKVKLSEFEKVCMIFRIRDRKRLEKLLKGDEELMELGKIVEDISTDEDLYEKYTKSELESIIEIEKKSKELAEEKFKEIKKQRVKELAEEKAKELAEEKAKELAEEKAKELAEEKAKE
ncbi:MAG: hypothetical protein ACI31R_06130, partial [Bacilli bacterium]